MCVKLLAAARVAGWFGVGRGGPEFDGRSALRRTRVAAAAALRKLLLRHDAVDFCENVMKCCFDVGGVQRGGLNEGQVVLLCEGLGLVGGDGPEVAKVRLVADQHDDDVGVGVVPQLAQPPLHVLVRQVLGDVVHQEGAHRAPVIRRRNRSVTLLAGSVPNLSLDRFSIDLYTSRRKFYTNCGL